MKINNPHDKLFKAILQDQTLAVDYFNHFLPIEVAEQIDFETLKLSNSSYIDEKLKDTYADIVFTCDLRNRAEPVEIALLLEHKSYVDRHAPFQILYYVTSAWMHAISNKQQPKVIIPILFYHGQEPWAYATIGDYFKGLDPRLAPYVPDFDFIYNNVTDMSDDQIRLISNQFLAANFLAMKHFYDRVWLERNLRALLSQSLPRRSKINSQFYVYVLNFVKLKKQEIMELLSTMPPAQTTEILSTYDQAVEEGRQEGKREELVQVVIASWKNNLELDLIASITKLTVDQVKEILAAQQLL